MKKKNLFLFLSLVFVLSVTACSKDKGDKKVVTPSPNVTETKTETTTAPTETVAEPTETAESGNSTDTEVTEPVTDTDKTEETSESGEDTEITPELEEGETLPVSNEKALEILSEVKTITTDTGTASATMKYDVQMSMDMPDYENPQDDGYKTVKYIINMNADMNIECSGTVEDSVAHTEGQTVLSYNGEETVQKMNMWATYKDGSATAYVQLDDGSWSFVNDGSTISSYNINSLQEMVSADLFKDLTCEETATEYIISGTVDMSKFGGEGNATGFLKDLGTTEAVVGDVNMTVVIDKELMIAKSMIMDMSDALKSDFMSVDKCLISLEITGVSEDTLSIPEDIVENAIDLTPYMNTDHGE